MSLQHKAALSSKQQMLKGQRSRQRSWPSAAPVFCRLKKKCLLQESWQSLPISDYKSSNCLNISLFVFCPPFVCSSFSSQPEESEEARARYLYSQWMGMGLTDVRLSNHTVLLSLPGSTPNTITDRSSHQCFLPSGIPCDQRGASELPRRQLSYAAYSAVGSLQVLRHFSDHLQGCGSFFIFPSIYLFSFFYVLATFSTERSTEKVTVSA